ncbi:MAG: transposase [Nostoc sp.]
MFDILALLQCLLPEIKVTTMRQLSEIVMAMLAMSGRVTMLGISRWTLSRGSYRTVIRFFGTVIPWATVFWVFFRRHLFCPNDVYLLAGDEVVISKAGKKTYGLDRFFSSDLLLSYEKIIDYYKLRFQIEFNFRDAKQFWGLEDFMNRGQTAVTNAVNLSFFMVNLSHYLLAQFREDNPGSGIVDLQAYCRGFRYVREMLKMLPQQPEPILLSQIFAKLTSLGRIHNASTAVEPS